MSLKEDIESVREDIKLYTKLSGEDGSQETIATIGAYLRGYRQGKEDEVTTASNNMATVQPDITHIVLETLNECGIYGEEATIKLIGTLKRLGEYNLLPPCMR